MRPRCVNCHRWFREGASCGHCEERVCCAESSCRNNAVPGRLRCRYCIARRSERNASCANCKRCSLTNSPPGIPTVTLQSISVDNISGGFRFKFALLQRDPFRTHVMLCGECLAYLSAVEAANKSHSITWPAFVWSVLRRPDIYSRAWLLVPQQWREWWCQSMITTHGTTLQELQLSAPLFADVTHAYNLDNKAIRELVWTGLMLREKSIALPDVKCPAGCSEYKHKSNDLPFDLVWEECLQTQLMPLMTDPIKRDFVRMFRLDYLIPDYHALNPAFPCKASITFNSSGFPVVLCCRHHDKNSKKLYLHPPKNPTGGISSTAAGGVSPTIVVPRTLHTARMSKYSASFQMAFMEGSYYGLDTMYLSSNSHITSVNSRLGWKQDVLAYAGRKDIRAHLRQRYEKTWQDKGCIGAQLDASARQIYPYIEELRAKFVSAATYVPLRDAVSMQQTIDFAGPEIGWYTDNDGDQHRVQFKGAYPVTLIWTHPAVSRRGCRPPQLPHFDKQANIDTRLPWLLSSMMLLIPEFWRAVATVQNKRDSQWEGHLLTYLTRHSLTHIQPQASRTNPFKRLGVKELINTYFTDNVTANGEFSMRSMRSMLSRQPNRPGRFDTLMVCNDLLVGPIDNHINLVIVTRDYDDATANNRWIPRDFMLCGGKQWKLCYVAETYANHNARNANAWSGTIHSRYSNDNMHDWWTTTRGIDLPTASSFDPTSIPVWDVCAYIATDSYVHKALRDQVLESCSGQSRVYCDIHNYPLITTATKNSNIRCSCKTGDLPDPDLSDDEHHAYNARSHCPNSAIFECASDDCTNAICKNHYSSVLDWSGKLFVSDTTCYYGHGRSNGVPLQFNTSKHSFNLTSLSQEESNTTSERMCNLTDNVMDPDNESSEGDSLDTNSHTSDGSSCSDVLHSSSPDETDGEVIEAHFRLSENMDPETFPDSPAYEIDNDDGAQFHGNYDETDGGTTQTNSRVRDNLDSETFATQARHGMDDMEDYDRPQDTSEMQELPIFQLPTTDAGAAPIFTYVDEMCDYSNATETNHIILNNFGHMLIRRNTKLNGTLRQRNFLQRMVARVPGDCLPLVYPEGMLFSNLFPNDMADGSLVGCIPSAALNSSRVLGELGFASLEDHYRTRLSNPGILASTDPKYHFFAFDCLSNLGLRGCDSRVILRRGFAEVQDTGGVKFRGSDAPVFDTEQVDSRPVVNKLAAAINEKPPTYFYTHTCSMKTHFGIKIIWDWLEGDEVLQTLLEGHESDYDRSLLRRNIVNSCGVLLLRSWMEIMHIWIKYITTSSEKPIGEVTDYLFRMELQDAKANLPHLHAMLWTRDDLSTATGLEVALDRIRGFICDIIRPEERERYKHDGIFENDDHIVRFMEMMATFLRHYHFRRCFALVKSKDGTDTIETRCKANDNFKDNPSPSQHTFVPINVQHSEDAIRIMSLLGLGTVDEHGQFIPIVEKLKAIKHYPPAHGDEGIISPVFGALVARNPSMSNGQFPTGYTLSRYLAKYIVSVDLYNVIRITPPRPHDDENTFNVTGTELPNQKITGNRMHQKQHSQTRNSGRVIKQRQGRAVNVAEFYMLLFGYSPIMTNIKFDHVVTRTYDERAARPRVKPLDALRKQQGLQHVALTPTNTIPSHYVRCFRHFPPWRQFLPSQVDTIFDDLQSPLSTSKVTIFSCRPPELLFVAKQCEYQQWFTLTKQRGTIEKVIEWVTFSTDATNLYASIWIDGFSNHVKVRAAAVPFVIQVLEQKACPWFHEYNQMLSFFENIQGVLRTEDPTQQQLIFLANFVVEVGNPKLPVIWYESVRPTRSNRFLVHLLLSMGFIQTEYELFTAPTIRHCFIKALLLDPTQPAVSATRLAKAYILQQLTCLPAGTNTFDKYLVAAYSSIFELFVHNQLHSDELPTAIYTRAKEETGDKIMRHLATKRLQLLRHARTQIAECGVPNLPTEDECLSATFMAPHAWDPLAITRAPQQPLESFNEQLSLLALCKHLVAHYKTCHTEHTKGLCQVGAAGVGKTTVLLIQILYAICQGLNTGITALLSERAQELAGGHIHDIFAMKGRDALSPGAMAERACAALYRNPEKLEYLRTLDVLALDEAGAVPCEMLLAMCTVLRYIRNSNRPYGGLLIFATMDYLQIEPVRGRHPLLSPMFTSGFFFRELQHSVRAALDAPWRRIQEITRLPPSELSSLAIRNEFVTLFTSTCTFVYDLNDPRIPRNILYAFGKKAPIRAQEKRILQRVQSSQTIHFVTSIANDEERTIDGNFRAASSITSSCLDRNVKEPRSLVLYVKGRYQITYNKQGVFSNSQLGILFDMPTQSHVDSKAPLTLTIAPPGCRYIPDETITKEELHELGWTDAQISTPKRHDVLNASGSVRARRQQYGLRHHIGSTIHAVMGQTLTSLLTRIERGDKTHPYALWLAAQVVVLISRTRLGAQTFFWLAPGTTPEETAEILYDLLCKSTPFRQYLTNVLRALCSQGEVNDTASYPYVIDHSTSIFRPCDVSYPRDDLGYVYLLISNRDLSTIYIGSTKNLLKRWKQHNTGFATKQTAPVRLRPWAMLAYIAGFDGKKTKYESIENKWIAAKEHLRATAAVVTVQVVHNLGKDLVAIHNRRNPSDNLRFVSCGTVELVTPVP